MTFLSERAYVRIPRRAIKTGLLRQLHDRAGGAVSLLPVLLLLACRTGEVRIRRSELRILAGIRPSAIARGLEQLRLHEVLTQWSEANGELVIVVRAEFRHPGNSFFFFPGYLITSGSWAGLTPRARLVLLTLAAFAHGQWHRLEEYAETEVIEWMDSLGALEDGRSVPGDDYSLMARRLGSFHLIELSRATGLRENELELVLKELARHPAGPVELHELEDPESPWNLGRFYYHLPAPVWYRRAEARRVEHFTSVSLGVGA